MNYKTKPKPVLLMLIKNLEVKPSYIIKTILKLCIFLYYQVHKKFSL